MDQSKFSQRLRQIRLLQGLSQYALAEALGVSRTSLKNWELAVSTPPIEVLVNIALYFRVSSDYLLGLDERRSVQINFLSDRMVEALVGLVQVMEEDTQAEYPSKTWLLFPSAQFCCILSSKRK